MALYSCVNEIMTHVTAVPERGSASKPNVGCGLTRQGAARIGALECVARLARGGHGPALSGGAGSFVAAVAKLLKSTDGSSNTSGRAFPNAWALTPDGARALRRCACRALAAVVGGASRDRPLRAEVRTAAARVVSDAIAHGLAHPLRSRPSSSSVSSRPGSSVDLIARELEETAEKSGHSCAREAFSLADLTGDRERMIPGAGRTVQAAACVAAGALASTPGGSGLWGDEVGRSGRAGSAKPKSAAEEMRDALRGALEEGDEETRGCAASALGALAAARLYPSEHTHASRVAPDGGAEGAEGADDTSGGALDDTPTKIGVNKKKPTHHRRSSSSGGGLFGGLMRGKAGGDAESSAASAAARAAAATAAAAAPLDLDGPGVDRRWTETIETCFVRSFRDACRSPGPDGRRARHGLASAMVRFTACVSEKSLERGKSVPARLLVGMTSRVYAAIAECMLQGGGMAREDAPHAEACALHVLRRGVIARLDEPGRGSLLRSLASTIFFGNDEVTDASPVSKVNVPGDTAMRAIAHALAAVTRVDDDTADALCAVVFRAMDSGGCPDEVAVCAAQLAHSAPRASAGLLRRSVEKISANAGAAGTMDATAVAAVAGGAAATAALVAAGDVLPLGLPGGLLRDAAASAFALVGGVVECESLDAECELRARGYLAAAGCLRGPSGRHEAQSRRDEILASLKKALDAKALRTLLETLPENDESGSNAKKSSAFGFMSSVSAKKKRRPGGPRWPPARELRWRAAAVDLLAAYAFVARTDDDESNDEKSDEGASWSVVEELLDDAARCSLVNTVYFFETDPRGEGAEDKQLPEGGYVDAGEWPADSRVAAQLASFRLATLRAFDVVHGENRPSHAITRAGKRGGFVGYSKALVALCGTPVRPLPGSNLGSACVVALRLALGRRGDDADVAAAPRSSGFQSGDAALDELRAFDGGWDAPPELEGSGFGFGFGYAAKGSGGGFPGFSRRFPRPAGLAATLQATRVRALAFLCAVDAAPLRFIEAEAGIVVKGGGEGGGGDDSNSGHSGHRDDSNPNSAVRRFEFEFGDGSGVSPASLVNACVAGLTLADSNRFKSFADDNDAVAASLIRVAGAIGSSRWSGPAHWRVAAELRARAAELGGDASAASLLTSLAASLPSTPPRRADPGDEKNPSANPSGADDVHLSGPCPRAVAASTAAATFRRAGALASTSATKPLVRSLLEASAQIDVGSDATHLWPLHALGEFIFYFRMGNLSDIVFCSQASWRITSGHRSPGTRPRCVAWRSR